MDEKTGEAGDERDSHGTPRGVGDEGLGRGSREGCVRVVVPSLSAAPARLCGFSQTIPARRDPWCMNDLDSTMRESQRGATMKRELSHAWRTTLTPLCVALPFFLSASLAAQWQPLTPEPKLAYGVTNFSCPSEMGSGPFQELVSADLDGDLILDAVVSKGGVPVAAW